MIVELPDLRELLAEYDRARVFTDSLWRDLSVEEICWRPHENSSAIGWHLGHQAHVAHFMIRNLTAAEPSPDPDLEPMMDAANPEPDRGMLPDLGRLSDFRATVAERVHARIGAIREGRVGAPAQLTLVGVTVMTALINHEYQHDQWIGEVRTGSLGHEPPPDPDSDLICRLDGYLVVGAMA
jgi:hypothetical protein